MIDRREILESASSLGLLPNVVEKDYVLGWLLAGINAHPALADAWVFKGGTCLKKCYFETYRFSEDLDFTLRDAESLGEQRGAHPAALASQPQAQAQRVKLALQGGKGGQGGFRHGVCISQIDEFCHFYVAFRARDARGCPREGSICLIAFTDEPCVGGVVGAQTGPKWSPDPQTNL